MQFIPMTLGILDPLYTAFGWMMRVLYQFIGNYGLAIIFFTILIRGLLIPLNVRSHKAMMKQQILAPQRAELERTYGDDKEKLQLAQMELYKQNDVSMTGGCLPMLLQLILIWPIYRIVSGPMYYIMKVPAENLQRIAEMLVNTGLYDSRTFANVQKMNIPLMQALRDMPSVLADAVNQGLMKATDLMNLDFLGLNLGLSPTISPSKLFGPDWKTWLPLVIIPLLALGTTLLSTKLSEVTAFNYKENKLQKERAKKNPAMSVDDNPQEGMMKSMKFVMPIMTLFFTFSMPAAMGLYWVIGNLMMVLQSLFMYFVYTRPVQSKQAAINAMSPEELAAYNRKLDEDPKVRKRKKKMAARQAKMEELLEQQEAIKRGDVPLQKYERKDGKQKDDDADKASRSGPAKGTPPKNRKRGAKNKKRK